MTKVWQLFLAYFDKLLSSLKPRMAEEQEIRRVLKRTERSLNEKDAG
jgi:hypothetical protein